MICCPDDRGANRAVDRPTEPLAGPSAGPLLSLMDVTRDVALPDGTSLPVLRGVTFDVRLGEVVAIVGRSGAGKSSLLNVLGLLDVPTTGSYLCAGQDIARLSDRRRSRLRGEYFGFVFQQFHLLERRTALDNVAEPLLYGPSRGIGRRHDRARVLLERVGLADRLWAMPHQLSGGEQQRVALARALVRSPQLILADEPTGSLDGENGQAVLALLLRLVREERRTLVLVTHDMDVAARADRVLTLDAGRMAG
ncbi:ABC transporter-like protein [Candidatus Protofrankia californiensis]|uniref:ABC transporter-like protein n=1 Tax=Candidatus Protofrankia californiensis TaxID=1839754 RepID=A0A1C3PE73_9ACTN|nr:ABC transporter-like protein [Candidatus Protofrankia californiensis]